MVPAYAHGQVFRMLTRSRTDRSRRRRLDRRSGYGSGYGIEWLMIRAAGNGYVARREGEPWSWALARGSTSGGTRATLTWSRWTSTANVSRSPRGVLVSWIGPFAWLSPTVTDSRSATTRSTRWSARLAICDVDDRAATLAEAYRVVRPGGLLLLLDHLERRWRLGRPATLGERVGFNVVERQRLWAGYFERVRLQKPGE